MRKKLNMFVVCMLVLGLIQSLSVNVGAIDEQSLNRYEYSEKTLSDYGGDYSLYYILNHFNHFIYGNASAGHTIGAIAVGGNSSYVAGNGNADYAQTTPSYLEGKINQIVADGYFQTLFVGESNSNGQFAHQNQNQTFISKGNKYIDFNSAFQSIKSELSRYQGTVTITTSDIQKASQLKPWQGTIGSLSETHFELSKENSNDMYVLKLENGYSYQFENTVLNKIVRIDLMNSGSENQNKDTLLIANDSGTLHLPYIYLNGKHDTMTGEWGKGLSAVYMLKNATEVVSRDAAQKHIGHIIAPNAYVHHMNGDVNGCIIANKLDIPNSESHMWTYTGQSLNCTTPASIIIKAQKTLDNKIPNKTFQFTCELISKPNGSTVSYLETATNDKGNIVFPELKVSHAGTYVFRIKEVIPTTTGNIDYDSKEYYAMVKVEKRGNKYQVSSIQYSEKKDAKTYDCTPQVPIFKNKTNCKKVGSLTIEKVSQGTTTPANATFTIQGPNKYVKSIQYKDFTDGKYTLSDLELGEYTVSENNADVDGYKLTVNGTGKVTLTQKNTNVTQTITNQYEKILGSLTIEKVTKGATTPADATFTIQGPNKYVKSIQYKDFTDGKYTLTNLELGEYTVKETNADVKGYKLKTESVKATLTSNETSQAVTLTNTYTATQVSILKVDRSTGKALSGATLAIFDQDNQLVEKWLTTESEHQLVAKLAIGEKYVLKELEAPKDYQKADDIEFTVTSTEKISIVMKDVKEVEYVDLVINKVDQDSQPLQGASFKLVKVVDGQEIEIETLSNGPQFVFEHLDDGVYRIYETVTPNGYKKADVIEVTIENGKIYCDGEQKDEITIMNTKSTITVVKNEDQNKNEVPQKQKETKTTSVNTSDEYQAMEYVMAGMLAMSAIYCLKKRKYE